MSLEQGVISEMKGPQHGRDGAGEALDNQFGSCSDHKSAEDPQDPFQVRESRQEGRPEHREDEEDQEAGQDGDQGWSFWSWR